MWYVAVRGWAPWFLIEVQEASIAGDRKTLKADSVIPLTMAVIYLLLMLYFKSKGGYKPLTIEEQEAA